MALAYKERLEQIEPNVKYLMTLYLSPDLTAEEVKKAKDAGIVGTTRSRRN
jgi:dihydroorotase